MPRTAIIITGGTLNLGFEAARAIATGHYPDSKDDHNEYLLVLLARTDKTNASDTINQQARAAKLPHRAVFRRLDLSDLANVRQFGRTWADGTAAGNTADFPPIHALLLNAGLQFPGALETIPSSGLEATFAVCHVGHALLFHLLVPFLDAASSDGARVLVTSSGTHDPAQKSGLPDAVYTSAEDLAHPPPDMVHVKGRQRYASSKLANVLWTYALVDHLERAGRLGAKVGGVTANAFDPGLMPGTGLTRRGTGVERFLWHNVLPRIRPVLRVLVSPNIHTAEASGRNLARLAVGPGGSGDPDRVDGTVLGVSGKYYEIRRPIPSSTDSYDKAKQEDLWDWTIKYLSKGDAAEEARFREFR
ncbi:short-chain dehydrogenase [Sporothrix schenckii 1099-18]|uniref:Short-chain dehydrogenase n=1 Tax=Sporothrix schenckii 1099-18 TaxID=1397361 RepID=A0A0F2M5Q9_SPOSC|nr:short-chain dehydrogenase [Sporothrix schenckii 1099-18]KJR84957.1 short-chain dehydrogenase [Sporothrix schenckii 1099-18]